MLDGKNIIVVMPAYNAEKTLEKTYDDIPKDIVDTILVVDDHSSDKTIEIAKRLNVEIFIHKKNKGYGANQKTCYAEALKKGADIIIMLHPDYQYSPKFIPAMAGLLGSGIFDIILGSRILRGYALKGGMPFYKYVANRALTLIQNAVFKTKISEFHTGYRAFTREALLNLPLLENSDGFLFDNQILAQAVHLAMKIGEISTPSVYTKESSSISFIGCFIYGVGVLWTTLLFLIQRSGLLKFSIFNPDGRKIGIKDQGAERMGRNLEQ